MNIDEIIIKYYINDIKDSEEIKLFGYIFVENKKDKCKIIINGYEYE